MRQSMRIQRRATRSPCLDVLTVTTSFACYVLAFAGGQELGRVEKFEADLDNGKIAPLNSEKGSTASGLSLGDCGDNALLQQKFTNHRAAGFVSFSAFRLSPTRFAVAGLGLAQGLKLNSSDGSPALGCTWAPKTATAAQVPPLSGQLSYRTLGESEWTAGSLLYESAVLFCDLPKTPSRSGGCLRVRLGTDTFAAYSQPVPLEFHEATSVGPFKHDIVFCGPPVFGSLEPRSVEEWLNYHLYYVGFTHAYIYQGGALDIRPMKRFLDAGVLTIVPFQPDEPYPAWYYRQGLTMQDCLFRNRETAAWVAFGDFDEYIVSAFKPPTSIRAYLQTQAKAANSPAWISRGGYYFYEYCEQQLWASKQGKFAVELLPYRVRLPMCHGLGAAETADGELCPGSKGRRKDFVNPRKVELMNVHMVYRLAAGISNSSGLILRVSDQIRHGHFRGLARKGNWCRKKKADLDSGLKKDVFVEDTSIAEIATQARDCAKRMGVPTWKCK